MLLYVHTYTRTYTRTYTHAYTHIDTPIDLTQMAPYSHSDTQPVMKCILVRSINNYRTQFFRHVHMGRLLSDSLGRVIHVQEDTTSWRVGEQETGGSSSTGGAALRQSATVP